MTLRALRPLAIAVATLTLVVGCGTGGESAAPNGKLAVVAAEDFWGSLARQLGGEHVSVESLIANPDTDPHDYEPSAADGRAMASAKVVIANGIGYDPWVDRMLAANKVSGRVVVDVGDTVGLQEGDNPHQWYAPPSVTKVIAAITAAYKRVDPSHAADYDTARQRFETTSLAAYRSTIDDIKARYGGTAVGASESIFVPMAEALGLRVLTPPGFMDAIAEGSDPVAADKAAVDEQIETKAIKVFVYNSQNATPDVRRLVDAAKANGIIVTTVTETVTPLGATFQDWQAKQLDALRAALASATATR